MYFEGFEEEGIIERVEGSMDSTVVDERVHHSGGTTITDRDHHMTASMEPGELAVFGFREQTLER